jgi:hypothetical protein
MLSAFALAGLAVSLSLTGSPAAAATVSGGGYIASLTTSPDLNCGVEIQGHGQAFFGGVACGTVLSAHGKIYQPSYLPIGNASASLAGPWSTVSQTMTGSGSPGDPYVILTTVMGWGITVTQADRYVAGEASYQTTYQVTNTATVGTSIQLYHVGDCDFETTRSSYGEFDGNLRMVTCRAPASDGSYSSKAQGTQFTGVGSHYFYGVASDLWNTINARSALPDTIGAGTARAIDGVIGLSWDKWLDPDQSATFTMRSVFQPAVGVPAPPDPPPSARPTPPRPTTDPGGQPTGGQPVNPPPGGSGSSTSRPYVPSVPGPGASAPSATVEPTADTTSEATATATATPTASPAPVSPTEPGPTSEPSPSEGPDSEGGEPDDRAALAAPLLYGGLGALAVAGFAGVMLLRRHGRPD